MNFVIDANQPIELPENAGPVKKYKRIIEGRSRVLTIPLNVLSQMMLCRSRDRLFGKLLQYRLRFALPVYESLRIFTTIEPDTAARFTPFVDTDSEIHNNAIAAMRSPSAALIEAAQQTRQLHIEFNNQIRASADKFRATMRRARGSSSATRFKDFDAAMSDDKELVSDYLASIAASFFKDNYPDQGAEVDDRIIAARVLSNPFLARLARAYLCYTFAAAGLWADEKHMLTPSSNEDDWTDLILFYSAEPGDVILTRDDGVKRLSSLISADDAIEACSIHEHIRSRTPGFAISPEPSPDCLAALFDRAKATDEFELGLTLLRVRGVEGPGWDPLSETEVVIDGMCRLAQAPITSATQLRLLLFTYCHVTEMDDLYNIIANLIRISNGHRFSTDCFCAALQPDRRRVTSPRIKIEHIRELSRTVAALRVCDLLGHFMLPPIRNAFFHSNYVLTQDSFNIVRSDGVLIDEVITPKIPLQWLVPRMELAINTAVTLIRLVTHHRRLFNENRIINGRMGPNGEKVEIELLTEAETGLVGFQSPPSRTNSGDGTPSDIQTS